MPIIEETIKEQARSFLALNGMPETIINHTIKRSVLDCLSFPHNRNTSDVNHIFTCFIHGSLEVFRNEQSKHERLMKKRFNKTVTCTIVNGDKVTEYEYKRY